MSHLRLFSKSDTTFKELDMIECLKNYGWGFITLYKRQWSKQSHKKEMQNGKMIVWGDLTNSWKKKRSERQRRKGKIHPSKCRVPKNSMERCASSSHIFKKTNVFASRIYNGEKTISLTSGAGKTGQPLVKEWN